MDEKRRSARKQPLPETEVEALSGIYDGELYARVRELFLAGWTLSSIGNAFNPPRVRSTVRSWVVRGQDETFNSISRPIPKPKLKTNPRGYVSRRPVSPGISPTDRARISELAPIARRYRAGMIDSSPVAVANRELEQLCRDLHAKNVTVKELASAAGVTYRAMARRLGK
jgi:hypothetical protein